MNDVRTPKNSAGMSFCDVAKRHTTMSIFNRALSYRIETSLKSTEHSCGFKERSEANQDVMSHYVMLRHFLDGKPCTLVLPMIIKKSGI